MIADVMYPTPRPGDVWEHVTSGDRVLVTAPGPYTPPMYRLVERDGKPWWPAGPHGADAYERGLEPSRYMTDPMPLCGVMPATDQDVEDDYEAARTCDFTDWDDEEIQRTLIALIARVRQEQARADSEERGRHQIEDERDALARRIDDVRAECIEALAVLGPGADGRHDLARLVLDLLDGEA